MYGSSDFMISRACLAFGESNCGFLVAGSTKSVPSVFSMAWYWVLMSPVASQGRAIGYFMSPASWIFLAAAIISSRVFGAVSPFLSKTSLR